jgi:hypothetical protein
MKKKKKKKYFVGYLEEQQLEHGGQVVGFALSVQVVHDALRLLQRHLLQKQIPNRN